MSTKPNLTLESKNGCVVFRLESPYPIGVSWAITQNGMTRYKESTMMPGESTTFSANEADTISAHWGYGPALDAKLEKVVA